MKKFWTILLTMGIWGCSPAEAENPSNTLREFYQAIASHDCQKARALSESYMLERCQKIASLKLGDELTVVEEQTNSAVVKFSLVYQLIDAHEPTATDATVILKRTGEQWKVDFSSLKILPSKTPPVASEPTPITPSSPASKPTGLLALWTADELQGKAGDEKIHWLRSPDFRPPFLMQPTESLPPLKPEAMNSIRRVHLPNDKKWVALTFDLCERADEIAGYDRGVVNVLRDKKVKATFYAGGKWMQSHPEQTMQLMADKLFEIGNHGWTHGNLRVLQGEAVQQQIVWTQAEYERIRNNLQDKAKSAGLEDLMTNVPHQPAGLRFPFGTCSPESLQATNALGLAAVQWDVVSGDPAITVRPSQIVRSTRSGSIVIFHANGRGRGTAAALPRIVDDLRAKGFEFVTVSELLAAGTIEAVDECYELKRGDNINYDAKYGDGMVRSHKKSKLKPTLETTSPKPVLELPKL